MAPAELSRFDFELADSYDATSLALEDNEEGLVDAFLEMTPEEQEFASQFVNFLSTGRFTENSATAAAPRRPR